MWENSLSGYTNSKKNVIYKFERGATDYRTSVQNNLTVVALKDNKSVYVASNCDTVESLSQMQ